MADTKISGLTALTGANTASGDLLTIVDVSDTTMAGTGTNKKITLTELQSAPVSGGTANGVLYLNGSKVATSGSALTFDGTRLNVGSSDTTVLGVRGVTKGVRFDFDSTQATIYAVDNAYFNSYEPLRIGGSDTRFTTSGTEQMRLTSTGLGIGTSSPGAKLDVQGGSVFARLKENTTGYLGFRGQNDSGNFYFGIDSSTGNFYGSAYARVLYSDGAYPMVFYTNAVERARIDSSGNLGLGVTPSAWGNGRVALDVKSNGAVYSGTNMVGLSGNAYDDGSWKRKAAAGATLYEASSQHAWYITGSSTAGSTISWTQAMTLDADGDLGIGTTSPVGLGSSIATIDIANTNGGGIRFRTSGAGNSAYLLANSSGVDLFTGDAVYMRFGTSGTERARIDSSGNLTIGSTSAIGKLGVWSSANGDTIAAFRCAGTGSQRGFYISADNSTGVVSLDATGAGAGIMAFKYGGTEAMRIDSSGNLLVGATGGGTFTPKMRVVAPGSQHGTEIQSNTVGYYAALMTNTAVSGDNYFIYFGTEANGATQRGSITYNRAGGLTAYNTTSDYRAKDIIGPVTGSGALIDSVPVYMGKMKGATQERPMFIAHETPTYAHTGEKDAVDADGNPVYQQMDASALIPVMWAEIQSLRKRLADAGIA